MLECGPLLLGHGDHNPGLEVRQVEHKVVGMAGEDLESVERLLRKVLEVERQDGLSAGTDRRRQDMPVIGVRQLQLVDQGLVVRDQAVGDRLVDQLDGPLDLPPVQLRLLM